MLVSCTRYPTGQRRSGIQAHYVMRLQLNERKIDVRRRNVVGVIGQGV
jgi:hypothetical protein